MKKIISIALLTLLTLLLLASCANTGYKNDAAVGDLAAAVDKDLGADNFTVMNEAYLKGAMKLDTSLFSDYVVKLSAQGVNIDEYGIFKAADEASVASVKEALEGYIKLRKDSWMDEYMPEEKPKLEAAELKVCGLYVMYAILDDASKKTAFDNFENALK
jgi:hypothetical protein